MIKDAESQSDHVNILFEYLNHLVRKKDQASAASDAPSPYEGLPARFGRGEVEHAAQFPVTTHPGRAPIPRLKVREIVSLSSLKDNNANAQFVREHLQLTRPGIMPREY